MIWTIFEEAVNSARRAVKLTPDNHPDRAGRLNNLGTMLQSRYERLSDRGDLEEAITATWQAVKSTPNNHPNRAILLYNLGTKLLRQYTLTREDGDLENALSTLQDAWHCQTATPFDSIRAGAQCLKLLSIQQKNNRAMRFGKDMIDFLPTVNTRLLDRKD
jgi:tetratricopeptide (TPR) repeat protein